MVRWVPIKLRARKSGFRAGNDWRSVTMTAMCGIVGYAGARPALSIVVSGLRRLEYRGYDSAGVAVINDETLVTCKRAGKLGKKRKTMKC